MNTAPRRTRRYRMRARAEAAAETGRRVLDAAIRHFGERPYDDVTLAEVAQDSGVTVQTVLRRFGSKERLVDAAAGHGAEEVRTARWAATPGDVDEAVRGLVEHYEEWGDRSLHFLAQEARVAAMRRITEAGRRLHHEWVEHAFAPQLAGTPDGARERLRAQLVAVTDVYVWKILRRDLGLAPRAAERAIGGLVRAIAG